MNVHNKSVTLGGFISNCFGFSLIISHQIKMHSHATPIHDNYVMSTSLFPIVSMVSTDTILFIIYLEPYIYIRYISESMSICYVIIIIYTNFLNVFSFL